MVRAWNRFLRMLGFRKSNRRQIPGDTPDERRRLRAIRMACINRIRTEVDQNGGVHYVFLCRCCDLEFRSPYSWGGNRKAAHADTRHHEIYFHRYVLENNIDYPPFRQRQQQQQPAQQENIQ